MIFKTTRREVDMGVIPTNKFDHLEESARVAATTLGLAISEEQLLEVISNWSKEEKLNFVNFCIKALEVLDPASVPSYYQKSQSE